MTKNHKQKSIFFLMVRTMPIPDSPYSCLKITYTKKIMQLRGFEKGKYYKSPFRPISAGNV